MTRHEARRVAGVAMLIVATAAACTGADAPAAEDGVERFAQELDRLRHEHRIPGLSAAVLRDGAVVLARGFGVADIVRELPATEDTPYDIASVSKPISAVVALKLVEASALDLDRPMAQYSEWRDFCQAFSRQPSIFARDLRCDPPTHTLRHLLTHTATGSPGEQFSYNPVLYSWASRPMMEVGDAPFSSLVARLVFAPAGMTRSARRYRDLRLPSTLAAALAPPHRLDETGAIVPASRPDPQGDGAAGGVISTVADLARFDQALDNGTLLAPASYEAMLTPARDATGSPLPYALGWYVQPHEGETLVWHSGWWEDAYSALYLKVPARRLTLILLANSEGLWWGNPLDRAEVHRSPFAQAFLRSVLRSPREP